MATLQARVESLIGTFSDTTSLTEWLTDGVHELVDNLPDKRLEKYSTNLSDSGSGIAVTGYRVLRAHKSGYGTRPVNPGLKTQVVDSGSKYYATATSPVYYEENGKGYVQPSGGTLIVFQYPTVAYSTTAGGTQFLTDFEKVIVLYTAIRATVQNISTAQTQMATYLETDEDSELAQIEGARINELNSLFDRLKAEYSDLIKGL